MKALVKYPFLNEEMEVSAKFNNNEWQEQKNAIVLEIGIDLENNEQHRMNLILSFGSPSGYLELVFYFNLTDIDNSRITSKPKSIYDREIAKKYLPKDLVGKNIFMPKLKEMLKQLLKMETPDKFFMETFEDHKNIKQKEYYDNLVAIIMNHGYVIEKQGVNPVTKKYAWKFLKRNSLPPLTEEEKIQDNLIFNKQRIKDEEYWKRHDAEAEKIMEEHMRQMREKI